MLGTFAIYHHEVHAPSARDIAMIEQLSRLVSIALEHKRTQAALRANEDMFRTLFETLPTGVLYESAHAGITSANPAAQRIPGLSLDQLQGRSSSDPHWRAVHEDGSDFSDTQHPISVALKTGQPVRNVIMGISVPRRDSVWLMVGAMPLRRDGKPEQAYLMFEDVTDRHEMVFYNALTQLPNRRVLTERLSQAISVSKRSGCYRAMMFLDLDNFKPLNDRHELGDLLLREVAWRLKTCVREQDTVSRIGGDEFVVSLSDLSECPAESRAQDSSVAEKILTLLADPYVLKVGAGGAPGRTVAHHCSASIGVTLFSPHGTDQAQILQRADAAMYQAKDGGRNRVQSSQGQG